MKDSTYSITLKCANCDEILKPVFDDMPVANPNLALHMTLHGGYGMYFDASDLSMYLCFSCASDLLAKFPQLNTKFQKHLLQYDYGVIANSESTET